MEGNWSERISTTYKPKSNLEIAAAVGNAINAKLARKKANEELQLTLNKESNYVTDNLEGKYFKVPVEWEGVPASYDLRSKVLGPDGSNLMYIKENTGAEVSLRGRGSGFLEDASSQESPEPLHIWVEHQNREVLHAGLRLVKHLMKTIHEEYLQLCSQSQQHTSEQQQSYKGHDSSLPCDMSHLKRSAKQDSQSGKVELYNIPCKRGKQDEGIMKAFEKNKEDGVKGAQGNRYGEDVLQEMTLGQTNSIQQLSLTQNIEQMEQMTKILQIQSEELLKYKTTKLQNKEQLSEEVSPRVPPLQFLPHQTPQPRLTQKFEKSWNKLEELAKEGKTDIPFGDMSSAASKKNAFIICNEMVAKIMLVPQNGESLYAALAYLLFGPVRSLNELTYTATTLHQRSVHFIRQNKEIFFTNLKSMYDELFPNHGLNPDITFEHCCLYLLKPDHLGVHHSILAIATLFSTPVTILHEEGYKPITINPIYPFDTSPIIILRRKRPHNHFDPVDFIQSFTPKNLLKDLYLNNPKLRISKAQTLLVATWDVESCILEGKQDLIDKHLAQYNVDLACIQGVLPSEIQLLTDNYFWFNPVSTTSYSSKGVGFLLNKKYANTSTNYITHSNHLVSVHFSINKIDFVVVGVYIPEPTTGAEQSYQIFNDLSLVLNRIPPSSQLFVLGQFHAQIGSCEIRLAEMLYIGPHLLHQESNENGSLLKNIAVNHRLCIANTFPDTNYSKATYRLRAKDNIMKKKSKLQISHILLREKLAQNIVKRFTWWLPLSNHGISSCNILLSQAL